MGTKTRLPCKGLAAAGTLALAVVVLAANGTTQKEPPDPRGTTLYMGQLRLLFATWDQNGDGYLDKEELAKAFRGPDAKPYDYKPKSKPTKDAPKDKAAANKEAPKDKEPAKDKDAGKKPAHPDYLKCPDYVFLVELDLNNDKRISRSEFMTWARDYAVQVKEQADLMKKLAAAQLKLANATAGTKTYQKHQDQVKAHQAALTALDKKMKAFEKALLKHVTKTKP